MRGVAIACNPGRKQHISHPKRTQVSQPSHSMERQHPPYISRWSHELAPGHLHVAAEGMSEHFQSVLDKASWYTRHSL
nr:hypothetical protein Iba_scaffold14766CG0040 [Ipomoea batatas]